jgi:hypothetical protein
VKPLFRLLISHPSLPTSHRLLLARGIFSPKLHSDCVNCFSSLFLTCHLNLDNIQNFHHCPLAHFMHIHFFLHP